jgi:hypothetical protein
MTKTAHGAVNVFNISDSERYRCQVLHYHARLSRLYISVYKDQGQQPVFYLLFGDVGYMECPTTWQGALFNIADQDACIQLMLEARLIGPAVLRFPAAYASLTDYARLYHTPDDKPVRILASSASMLHSVPPEVRG